MVLPRDRRDQHSQDLVRRQLPSRRGPRWVWRPAPTTPRAAPFSGESLMRCERRGEFAYHPRWVGALRAGTEQGKRTVLLTSRHRLVSALVRCERFQSRRGRGEVKRPEGKVRAPTLLEEQSQRRLDLGGSLACMVCRREGSTSSQITGVDPSAGPWSTAASGILGPSSRSLLVVLRMAVR